MLELIVTLGISKAIDKIKDREEVFIKHGVWNEYKKVKTKDAIEGIKKSGYGADIYYDDEKDEYYVSVPCDSDMW